jgi:hypothetical protein
MSAPIRGTAACALTSALLLGCGGGGGGGGSPTLTPTPTPTPTTTESRTQGVAIASVINSDIKGVQSGLQSAITAYKAYFQLFAAGNSSRTCTSSGTYDISVTNSGVPMPQAGNQVVLTYNNCLNTGSSVTLTGTVTLTWNSASGDPTASDTWSAHYSVAYQSLTEAGSTDNVRLNGTVNYAVTSTDATQKNVTTTFTSLVSDYYSSTLPITSDFSGQVATYAVDASGNTSVSLQNSYSVNYNDGSNSLSFAYTPVTPFTFDTNGNPTGGDVKVAIHSAGPVTAQIFTAPNNLLNTAIPVEWSVLNANSGTLTTDLDGNGTYETTYTINFTEL